MPRKAASSEEPTIDLDLHDHSHLHQHDNDAHDAPPVGLTHEEKLDLIVHYLHQMNSRDRLRTVGGFFKTLIGFIPIIIVVWSTWYFYKHGAEVMEQITKEAVKQSAEYSQESLMDQLEQYIQQ